MAGSGVPVPSTIAFSVVTPSAAVKVKEPFQGGGLAEAGREPHHDVGMDRAVAQERNLGDAIDSVREHTRIGGGDEVKGRSRVDADVRRADGVAGENQGSAAERETETFEHAEVCHNVFPFIVRRPAREVVFVCVVHSVLATTSYNRKNRETLRGILARISPEDGSAAAPAAGRRALVPDTIVL